MFKLNSSHQLWPSSNLLPLLLPQPLVPTSQLLVNHRLSLLLHRLPLLLRKWFWTWWLFQVRIENNVWLLSKLLRIILILLTICFCPVLTHSQLWLRPMQASRWLPTTATKVRKVLWTMQLWTKVVSRILWPLPIIPSLLCFVSVSCRTPISTMNSCLCFSKLNLRCMRLSNRILELSWIWFLVVTLTQVVVRHKLRLRLMAKLKHKHKLKIPLQELFVLLLSKWRLLRDLKLLDLARTELLKHTLPAKRMKSLLLTFCLSKLLMMMRVL